MPIPAVHTGSGMDPLPPLLLFKFPLAEPKTPQNWVGFVGKHPSPQEMAARAVVAHPKCASSVVYLRSRRVSKWGFKPGNPRNRNVSIADLAA